MKSKSLLFSIIALLSVALPASLHAAKDPEKESRQKAVKAVLAQYDKNNNGIIDGEEVDAVKKAYEADPNGMLKRFDLNNDGKLDDSEVGAIVLKKKKKNQT